MISLSEGTLPYGKVVNVRTQGCEIMNKSVRHTGSTIPPRDVLGSHWEEWEPSQDEDVNHE